VTDPSDGQPEATSSRRLLTLAIAGEGALVLVALAWAHWRGQRFEAGPWAQGILLGLATAVALAALQYWLLRLAPGFALVRSLRALYRDVLRPLFSRASLTDILIVSAMAGLGEELLFRGVMQPAWGWLAASAVFGACHIGGRATLALGVWAGIVGLWLGWLAAWSGGLVAPVVAHAVYDAMALSYIRWGRPDSPRRT
jgi:membrane protease YdiL (CAAX protease family)